MASLFVLEIDDNVISLATPVFLIFNTCRKLGPFAHNFFAKSCSNPHQLLWSQIFKAKQEEEKFCCYGLCNSWSAFLFFGWWFFIEKLRK